MGFGVEIGVVGFGFVEVGDVVGGVVELDGVLDEFVVVVVVGLVVGGGVGDGGVVNVVVCIGKII